MTFVITFFCFNLWCEDGGFNWLSSQAKYEKLMNEAARLIEWGIVGFHLPKKRPLHDLTLFDLENGFCDKSAKFLYSISNKM